MSVEKDDIIQIAPTHKWGGCLAVATSEIAFDVGNQAVEDLGGVCAPVKRGPRQQLRPRTLVRTTLNRLYAGIHRLHDGIEVAMANYFHQRFLSERPPTPSCAENVGRGKPKP